MLDTAPRPVQASGAIGLVAARGWYAIFDCMSKNVYAALGWESTHKVHTVPLLLHTEALKTWSGMRERVVNAKGYSRDGRGGRALVDVKGCLVDGTQVFVDAKGSPADGERMFVDARGSPVDGTRAFVDARGSPADGWNVLRSADKPDEFVEEEVMKDENQPKGYKVLVLENDTLYGYFMQNYFNQQG
eukprot:4436077-Pyramimonas_sp.AAC.1